MTRVVATAALFLLTLLACTRRPDGKPDASDPRADLEPSDAGPAPWPGWPPPATGITAAMICQAAFAPNADLRDACMRDRDATSPVRAYNDDALAACSVRLERSVLNGRAAIDPAGAQECIQKRLEVRRSGRADHGPSEHSCDRAVVGKLPSGAACREEWECAPGLGCANLSKAGPGKCTMPADANALCTTSDVHFDATNRGCAKGLWCGAERCVPANKEGEDCQPGSCGEGLFCLKGTLKCVRALVPAGGVCKRTEDCENGHYCQHTPKAPSQCVRQKHAGEKCLDGLECAGDCRSGHCISLCGSP